MLQNLLTEYEVDMLRGRTVNDSLDGLQYVVHKWALSMGFYDRPDHSNPMELLNLIHEEVSEVTSSVRRPGPSPKAPTLSHEEEEVADVLIRLMDYCGFRNLRLKEAFHAKMAYNLLQLDGKLAGTSSGSGKVF